MNQGTNKVYIDEILVLSSGSTDKTDMIVEEFSKRNGRVVLLRQDRREGKASAVNELLRVTSTDVLVLESADTIPREETIERLCQSFMNGKVGMTGAHPMPVNDEDDCMGCVTHLIWKLHHRIAMRTPKCGELIAFRMIFNRIPADIAVDEAWIEYEILRRGYDIVYVPDAIVYNKGPENVRDHIRQRRRIACGHLDLARRTKYRVSSLHANILLLALLEVFPLFKPREWPHFFGAMVLEGLSRILGYYDFVKGERHVIWDIAETTKRVQL